MVKIKVIISEIIHGEHYVSISTYKVYKVFYGLK